MKFNYKNTIVSCFLGYIVQAVIVNFVPLLFVTFQNTYSIPLSRITLLVTVNFGVQLLVDLLATRFVDKIGYRFSIVLAHITSALGLIFLTFLPEIIDPFTGILISVMIYAVGGGIIEVLVSPIMESCPTDNKEKAMSLLHSFYSWGQVGVILITTLFFVVFGIENWRILSLIWAALPAVNAILFLKTPIAQLISSGEKGMTLRQLFLNKAFWILLIMMICSGAAEQAINQWASAFAEEGLGVSKAIGDIAGPMTFAAMMGITRLFYGKYGDRIALDKFMLLSSALCVISYLLACVTALPVLSLFGFALCGISVGIMWPGTISQAALTLKYGGTAMFAMLALAGDLGCSIGPSVVGAVTSAFGSDMKYGLFAAVIFPALLMILILFKKKA